MRSSSRRAVLAGACAACAASVAGCARYGTSYGLAGAPAQSSTSSSASSATSATGTSSAGASSSGGANEPATLAKTTEIPVGGGKILSGPKIVITQPKAGTFHAFTAICTHQGCIVSTVASGTIDCPCHGSKYSAVNGSVVNGPATLPLAAVSITVKGTSIIQA